MHRLVAVATVLHSILATGGGREDRVEYAATIPFPWIPGVQGREEPKEVLAESLLNVTRFTEWPGRRADSGSSAIRLCLAPGAAQYFEEIMRQFSLRQSIAERNRLLRIGGPSELAQCDAVFLANLSAWNSYLSESRGKAILTLSTAPDFIERGGMVQLDPNDGSFEVHLDRVQSAGISMQPQMLKQARRIHTGSTERNRS